MKNFDYFILICSVLISCEKDIKDPTPPVANAGVSQAIQLPASPITLTGSGTTQNGNITGYIWSTVSGPNVPVITSPSSPKTTVTGYVAGTYIFQLLVVDDAGFSDVDTSTVIVTGISPSIQTLTLQPNNNPDERHLYGNSSSDQSTSTTELVAATWTNGPVVYVRGAFKFDLSSIPSSATILTAKLSLYSNPSPLNGSLTVPNEGPDNSMFIRRISNSWNASTAFWSNQPQTTTVNQISIPHTNLSSLDLIDVDVKKMIATMHSDVNYGFMIQLQNEVIYNMRNFCSSRNSATAKHPKLVVTYQP